MRVDVCGRRQRHGDGAQGMAAVGKRAVGDTRTAALDTVVGGRERLPRDRGLRRHDDRRALGIAAPRALRPPRRARLPARPDDFARPVDGEPLGGERAAATVDGTRDHAHAPGGRARLAGIRGGAAGDTRRGRAGAHRAPAARHGQPHRGGNATGGVRHHRRRGECGRRRGGRCRCAPLGRRRAHRVRRMGRLPDRVAR